jgi:hypothetical protein
MPFDCYACGTRIKSGELCRREVRIGGSTATGTSCGPWWSDPRASSSSADHYENVPLCPRCAKELDDARAANQGGGGCLVVILLLAIAGAAYYWFEVRQQRPFGAEGGGQNSAATDRPQTVAGTWKIATIGGKEVNPPNLVRFTEDGKVQWLTPPDRLVVAYEVKDQRITFQFKNGRKVTGEIKEFSGKRLVVRDEDAEDTVYERQEGEGDAKPQARADVRSGDSAEGPKPENNAGRLAGRWTTRWRDPTNGRWFLEWTVYSNGSMTARKIIETQEFSYSELNWSLNGEDLTLSGKSSYTFKLVFSGNDSFQLTPRSGVTLTPGQPATMRFVRNE